MLRVTLVSKIKEVGTHYTRVFLMDIINWLKSSANSARLIISSNVVIKTVARPFLPQLDTTKPTVSPFYWSTTATFSTETKRATRVCIMLHSTMPLTAWRRSELFAVSNLSKQGTKKGYELLTWLSRWNTSPVRMHSIY